MGYLYFWVSILSINFLLSRTKKNKRKKNPYNFINLLNDFGGQIFVLKIPKLFGNNIQIK